MGLNRTCDDLFPQDSSFTHQHFHYSRHQGGQEPRWSLQNFRAKAYSPAQDPTQHQSENRAGFLRQPCEHPCPAPTSSIPQLLWSDSSTQASCSQHSTPIQEEVSRLEPLPSSHLPASPKAHALPILGLHQNLLLGCSYSFLDLTPFTQCHFLLSLLCSREAWVDAISHAHAQSAHVVCNHAVGHVHMPNISIPDQTLVSGCPAALKEKLGRQISRN